MIKLLLDRDMEGPGSILWGMLTVEGWVSFFSLHLVALAQVLPEEIPDDEVWRFAQAHQMIFLTHHLSRAQGDLLEHVIRTENQPSSFPVVSIVHVPLLTIDRNYQEICLDRLLEILENLEYYKGTGRLFIP